MKNVNEENIFRISKQYSHLSFFLYNSILISSRYSSENTCMLKFSLAIFPCTRRDVLFIFFRRTQCISCYFSFKNLRLACYYIYVRNKHSKVYNFVRAVVETTLNICAFNFEVSQLTVLRTFSFVLFTENRSYDLLSLCSSILFIFTLYNFRSHTSLLNRKGDNFLKVRDFSCQLRNLL